MHTLHAEPRTAFSAAALSRLSPARVLSRLAGAAAVSRQRRALRDLDEAILRDIGLTRDEALREAARPFWDAPVHWRG